MELDKTENGISNSESHISELKEYLRSLESVAVAFSGGVDSSFLLRVSLDALGRENVLAVTIESAVYPKREENECVNMCKEWGVNHVVLHADELSVEGFAENPRNRCYICKHYMFSLIKKASIEHGIINVIEGTNFDDLSDVRPGLQAIQELGILSPLLHFKFTKNEIRSFLKAWNISVWNKPSMACLASRVPYGTKITRECLAMAERAEDFLFDMGFTQCRARISGKDCRIELLPSDFGKAVLHASEINTALKAIGFTFVSLDLGGYKTGNMNVKDALQTEGAWQL